MIPYKDKFLAIATPNSLHVLSGEPSDGNLFNVSDQFGIIAPKAWAVSPEGTVAFLSYNGVYLWKLAVLLSQCLSVMNGCLNCLKM